jgi:hypothetical protein
MGSGADCACENVPNCIAGVPQSYVMTSISSCHPLFNSPDTDKVTVPKFFQVPIRPAKDQGGLLLGAGVVEKGVRNRNFFFPKKLAQALATVDQRAHSWWKKR